MGSDISCCPLGILLNASQELLPVFTSTSPEGQQSTAFLDAGGRIANHGIPGFDPITFTYDSRRRLSCTTPGSDGEARTSTITNTLKAIHKQSPILWNVRRA